LFSYLPTVVMTRSDDEEKLIPLLPKSQHSNHDEDLYFESSNIYCWKNPPSGVLQCWRKVKKDRIVIAITLIAVLLSALAFSVSREEEEGHYQILGVSSDQPVVTFSKSSSFASAKT
jgi:hypothetical protein